MLLNTVFYKENPVPKNALLFIGESDIRAENMNTIFGDAGRFVGARAKCHEEAEFLEIRDTEEDAKTFKKKFGETSDVRGFEGALQTCFVRVLEIQVNHERFMFSWARALYESHWASLFFKEIVVHKIQKCGIVVI
jgi:hypothetical protein